jgi:hypothetical protein
MRIERRMTTHIRYTINDSCTLYGARRSVIECLTRSHESCRELGSDQCNRPSRRRTCRRHFSDLFGEPNAISNVYDNAGHLIETHAHALLS